MHPRLAEKLGVVDGDFVKVESRRGNVVVRAMVVKTIRPDTVFVPYHWPLDRSANNMTVRAIDPVSNIPNSRFARCESAKPKPADEIAHQAPRPEAGERTVFLH
jgi:assimilatory nitrate reductase catalytic subunit